MEALKQVLESVGVWGWLLGRFPDKSELEVLKMVHDDFPVLSGVLRALPPFDGRFFYPLPAQFIFPKAM